MIHVPPTDTSGLRRSYLLLTLLCTSSGLASMSRSMARLRAQTCYRASSWALRAVRSLTCYEVAA